VTLEAAAAALRAAGRILVFTGAGISTESGIPDFRGPDGLWTKVDPDDFKISRYVSNRDLRVRGWQMHCKGELWGARSSVRPNLAHEAIVELARHDRLSGCVTQNIDGLHQAAGLSDDQVAELHGNVRKAHCLGCDHHWPTEAILERVDSGDDDPHCEHCGGLIKTTTVMFGELLPTGELAKATEFAESADAVLAIGTTLSVYPAANIPLEVAGRGAPMIIVNMGATDHDHRATVKVEGRSGEIIPALVEKIV